jgi:hypothetical protein
LSGAVGEDQDIFGQVEVPFLPDASWTTALVDDERPYHDGEKYEINKPRTRQNIAHCIDGSISPKSFGIPARVPKVLESASVGGLRRRRQAANITDEPIKTVSLIEKDGVLLWCDSAFSIRWRLRALLWRRACVLMARSSLSVACCASGVPLALAVALVCAGAEVAAVEAV